MPHVFFLLKKAYTDLVCLLVPFKVSELVPRGPVQATQVGRVSDHEFQLRKSVSAAAPLYNTELLNRT